VTHDASYKDAALKIAQTMLKDFADGKAPLVDRTADPAAAGVFATKLHPFVHDILAARFLATVAKASADPALAEAGKQLLAATCTPKALDERGRMLGEVLLTMDDLGLVSW
jgi:mannose/cellobiose epimerase-like protein (N-acyl-D-glucosamine 2-epimerase family)